MDANTLVEALQSSALATVISTEIAHDLAPAATCKQYAAGTILFREGEQSDAFFVIHRGHVILEMCLPARGCTRLLTLGPGDIVAWSALVGDGRMTATAITADEAELIELSGTELLRRCEADAQFGYRLMRCLSAALAKRLLATRLQLLDLFAADVSSYAGSNG